jgi:hypothetical protein
MTQAKLYPITPRERRFIGAGLALLLALLEEETDEGQDRARLIAAAATLVATGRGEIPVSRLPIADKADPAVPFAEVVKRDLRERLPEIRALADVFLGPAR